MADHIDVEKKGMVKAQSLNGSQDADGLRAMGLGSQEDGSVKRKLQSRHLQMIALGGTIGTGLFVGAGGALANGGPLGVLLGYSIMGIVVYAMMLALGEMTTLFPVAGAFTHYAARFVDPALGFALGWNYFYSWAITTPTEIVAAALVINYWPGAADINPAAWISIFFVFITLINFVGVRAYGEAEFIMSVIKIITILGLILLGIIITCGGGPNHETIGFRFWRADGPFQQQNGIPGALGQFLSFWTVFLQASFSFLGTEIVALTAGEAADVRRAMPKAIRRVFWRILFFYVVAVFIMGLLVSPNDDQLLNGSGTNASPWVIAIERAGISGLPSVINAVVLIAAFSAGNSDVYASSRTLYGLACDGKAPAFLRKCNTAGVPYWAVGCTAAFGLLAYMCVQESANTVFNWLYNLSAITGLIAWWSILLSYLRFYYAARLQGIDRNTFPYKAPFQPYLSWFGIFFLTLVIMFNGYTVFLAGSWDTSSFIVAYIGIPIYALFYLFWKFYKKTSIIPLAAIDFETGRRELDAMTEADELLREEPKTFWGKILAAIF